MSKKSTPRGPKAKTPVLIDVPLKLTPRQIAQLSGAADRNGCTIGELVYALATVQLEGGAEEDRIEGDLMRSLQLFASGKFEPSIMRDFRAVGFREKAWRKKESP